MRIDYTPETRYRTGYMPIKDCCNSSHVDAYLTDEAWHGGTIVRLQALQVMRDYGLLPDTHRQLMRMRRQFTALVAEERRLFALAQNDYARWWAQYQTIKWQATSLKREAEDVYNAMFHRPEWQGVRQRVTDEPVQLALW